jgi:hypothetical protein
MRITMVASLLTVLSAHAGVIYQASGPDLSKASLSQQLLYGSWSQAGSFTGVTISALLSAGAVGNTAFLTNLIGPTATAANVIAFTSWVAPIASTQVQLFAGLDLGPGTYYLVFGAGGGLWESTAATPPTVSTASGVTGNGYGFCNSQSGVCNFANPYASIFVSSPVNTQFLVDGTAVVLPEPVTSSLVVQALIALIAFRKFSHAKKHRFGRTGTAVRA